MPENLEVKITELKSKSFIRLNDEGEPQLVLVSPVINEIGMLDPDHVAVFLDEDGPHVISREAIDTLLIASDCVPLEEINHKNRIH